jgi:hypothetical protein
VTRDNIFAGTVEEEKQSWVPSLEDDVKDEVERMGKRDLGGMRTSDLQARPTLYCWLHS